jgi:arylsulfatase A-like enzyme
MDRRKFLGCAATMAALPFVQPSRAGETPRGVFLIIADDLFSIPHYRTKFGVTLKTPNFGRLMRRGVSFMNAFCSTPICNPSRAAMLSGMNPYRTGVHYNFDKWQFFIRPEHTVYAMLKRAGWHTFSFGKSFHNINSRLPHARYIDEIFYAPLRPYPNRAEAANVNAALRRIADLPVNRPFFMTIGLYDPHVPLSTQQRYRDLYPLDQIKIPDWEGDRPPNWVLPWLRTHQLDTLTRRGLLDEFIQGYLANVSEMDASLGRLIHYIDRYCPGSTIIMTSDHGFSLGEHDTLGKFNLWDEAGRSPLVIANASNAGARVYDVVSTLDVLPTVLDLAGVRPSYRLDGTSLLPFLNEVGRARRTGGALTTMLGATSLRRNTYRYSVYPDGSEELFHAVRDPGGRDNLIDNPGFAAVARAMRRDIAEKLADWKGANPKCRVTVPPDVVEIC